ncbi:hypothetical protein TIFTF001_015556 [Ficus carica]|uniref:Uncharacterized protein n=1 Tax=Ficus carica TaxID=3494 RepID=A0AA88A7E7_FICCA|nr:hypothetical protein TIFTF001_015556 [Ficus carica]
MIEDEFHRSETYEEAQGFPALSSTTPNFRHGGGLFITQAASTKTN